MTTEQLIPFQYTGGRSHTTYSVRKPDVQSAGKLFEKARADLLNINQWHIVAGTNTVFQLVSTTGEELQRPVNKGDFVRISLPVIPGPAAGQGYEWVQVEQVEEQRKGQLAYTIIKVRPCSPPFIPAPEVAHFFTNDATSSFCVLRKGRTVTAAVYGRNEVPNVKTPRFMDKLRNFFVAIGAMLGFNKPQWKSLVRGLLRKNSF